MAVVCLNAAHAQQTGLDLTDVVGATPVDAPLAAIRGGQAPGTAKTTALVESELRGDETVSADLGFRGRAGTQGRLRAAAQRSVELGLEFEEDRRFMAVGESTSVKIVTTPRLQGNEQLDVELFFVNTSATPFALLPGEYVTFTSERVRLTARDSERTVMMAAALSLPGNRSVAGAVWAVAAQARNVTVVGTLDPGDAFRDAERDVLVGAGPTYSAPYTIGPPDSYDVVITPQTIEVAPGECAGFTVRTRQALLDDEYIQFPFDFDTANYDADNGVGFNSDRKQRTGSTTIKPGVVLMHIWNVRIGGPDANTYDGAVPAPGQSYTDELCASSTAEVGRTFVSEIDGGLRRGSLIVGTPVLNITVVASNPFTAFLSPGAPADLPAGFPSDSTVMRGDLSLGIDPAGMITVSLDENDRVREATVRVGLEVVPAGSPLSLSASEVTLAPPDYTAAVSATVPSPRRAGTAGVRTMTGDSATPVDPVELSVSWEALTLPTVTVSLNPAGELTLASGEEREVELRLTEHGELPPGQTASFSVNLDAADATGLSLSRGTVEGVKALDVELSAQSLRETMTLVSSFNQSGRGTLTVRPPSHLALSGNSVTTLEVTVEPPRLTARFVAPDENNADAASDNPAGSLTFEQGELAVVYVRLCSSGAGLCREADSPLRGGLRGQNVVLQASVSDGFTLSGRRTDLRLEFGESRAQEKLTVGAGSGVNNKSGALTLSVVSGVTLVSAAGNETSAARLRVQVGEISGHRVRVKAFLEGALE